MDGRKILFFGLVWYLKGGLGWFSMACRAGSGGSTVRDLRTEEKEEENCTGKIGNWTFRGQKKLEKSMLI